MNSPTTCKDLYTMLELLKKEGVLSIHNLSGDDIFLLEKLVAMKLASKHSTRITTLYFYGASES